MPRRNAGPRLVWVAARRRWYISWTDGGRNHRRSAGQDRSSAQAALAAFILAGGNRPAAVDAGAKDRLRSPAEYPVAELLLDYAQEHGPDVAAPRALGSAIGQLAAWWADRATADITPAAVDAYRRQRQSKGRRRGGDDGGAAPATVDRELTVLRAAVNWARKNNRLIDAPHVAVGKSRPGRDRWLSAEEAAMLLATADDGASPPHIALFVRLALYLGARHAAILDLTWDRVDLSRRLVRLNPAGREQTAKRRPEVAIPEALLAALVIARAGATCNHVIAWRGRPIRSARRGFAAAARRAGFSDVTPHTLRHTCATWLSQAGVPMWTVAGFLGHEDIRTTAQYAHHAPGHLRDAADALDRAMRGAA